jgi:tetratricopeptide (TPR) repeat protein
MKRSYLRSVKISMLAFVLITTLGACSRVSTQSTTVADAQNIETDPAMAQVDQETLEKVKAKLLVLVDAAKKSANPYSVNYLSSDLYLKASAASAGGDFSTANILYSTLLELTDDDYVKTKYAVSLIRAGDLSTAEQLLHAIYSKDQKNHKVGLVLAGVHTGLGKLKEAQTIYHSILKQQVAHEDACVFLSKSLVVEDKMDKAIEVLEKCQSKAPKVGVFSYYIGKIYVDKANFQKARQYFEKALRHESDYARAVLALGIIHEEANQNEKAVDLYKKFLSANPNDKNVLSRLVQTLFSMEKYNEVLTFAERLSDLEPDNLNLKVKLGILYSDNKRFDKAISIFKDLLSFAPTSDKILYYLGAIYQETKQFDAAIDVFSKVPSSSALFQDASVQIAHMMSAVAKERFIQFEDKSYESKFFAYIDEKVQEMSGLKVELAVVKAGYFEGIENFAAATTELEAVRNDGKFSAKHQYYLANLYDQQKVYEKSDSILKDLISIDPENSDALNLLGYSYIEREENMDEAYRMIIKALDMKPNDGYYRDTLGWYFYKKGHMQKALKEIQFAHKIVPDDSTISMHYAIILKNLNKIVDSKKMFEKAVRLTRSSQERKMIERFLEQMNDVRIPASDEVVQKTKN